MFEYQGGGARMSEMDRSTVYSAPVRLASLNRDWLIEALVGYALGTPPDGEGFAYSPAHLRRMCHEAVGEPLASFARRLRLERAAGRLSLAEGSVTVVAREAGYASAEAFAKAFAAQFGASPTEFARTNRQRESLLPGYLIAHNLRVPRVVELRRADGKTARLHYKGALFLAVALPDEALSWSWRPPLT